MPSYPKVYPKINTPWILIAIGVGQVISATASVCSDKLKHLSVESMFITGCIYFTLTLIGVSEMICSRLDRLIEVLQNRK